MTNKTLRPVGGHVLDIDSSEIGEQFLTLANNVNTRKGFPSRRGGRRIAYPVSAGHLPNDPRHLLNLQLNTFNWWMSFGTNNIWAIEGTNFYDITMLGMQSITNPYEWSATLLNGIPVFSNGKDVLLYWNGSGGTDAVPIPGFPLGTAVKSVVAFRFHLFGLDVDGPGGHFDNQIMWSDAAAPGTLPASWTPAASNEAGNAILADTPGRCVTALPLGPRLMIYKPQSVYPVEYSGQQPNNIFTIRDANRSLGALGQHCVADLGGAHIVLGNDDVCLFDGVNVKSIAENRVKIAIANSIDGTYGQNSFIVRDINKRETWICIPESGSQFATIAHIWDERRDTWTTRSLTNVRHGTVGYVTDTTLSNVWDSQAAAWDTFNATAWNANTVGTITRVVVGELDTMYVEDTNDATAVTATIAKNDMAFDDDTQFKLITSLWLRGTGLGFASVEFRLGARLAIDDSTPITWQAWQPVRSDGQLTIPEITGRYISIEIRATSTTLWTIDKIIFGWKFNGSY